jgi:Cd2+/Zn2+-exporting ATPase
MLPMAPPEPPAAEETAPSPDVSAERYRVEGMDCASCAKTVEKAVAAMDGVRAARVSTSLAQRIACSGSPLP